MVNTMWFKRRVDTNFSILDMMMTGLYEGSPQQ
jgi:hypothetical protein